MIIWRALTWELLATCLPFISTENRARDDVPYLEQEKIILEEKKEKNFLTLKNTVGISYSSIHSLTNIYWASNYEPGIV